MPAAQFHIVSSHIFVCVSSVTIHISNGHKYYMHCCALHLHYCILSFIVKHRQLCVPVHVRKILCDIVSTILAENTVVCARFGYSLLCGYA